MSLAVMKMFLLINNNLIRDPRKHTDGKETTATGQMRLSDLGKKSNQQQTVYECSPFASDSGCVIRGQLLDKLVGLGSFYREENRFI